MKYKILNVSEETWDQFRLYLLDVTKESGGKVDADAGVAMLLTQRRTDAEVRQLIRQFLNLSYLDVQSENICTAIDSINQRGEEQRSIAVTGSRPSAREGSIGPPAG